MQMTTQACCPATSGLGIALDGRSRSVPSSPGRASRSKSAKALKDLRPDRAASEPVNISYHPELYQKLNLLWGQTSQLITSQTSQQPTESPQAMDTVEPYVESPAEAPAMTSIVDSVIFKILYHSQANLQHFNITKQELPFAQTVHNREYMGWVAAKEPGFKINYDEIRSNLARLTKEPSLRQHSPNVFNFFSNLLKAHDTCVVRGARFLSYDLYMKMIEAYFGTQGDVELLARFPITDQAAFQIYVANSSRAMSEQALQNRKRNWTELHEQWLGAEKILMDIKINKEFHRRYDQLKKLMKIFHNRFEERVKRHRVLRQAQVSRRTERRRLIKGTNVQAIRHQTGQAGLYDISEDHLQALRDQMTLHTQQYINRQDGDDTQDLPDQLEGMKIEDFPDTAQRLMPATV